jgi:uncharacterized protein YjcR
MFEAPGTDWEAIEREFRLGQLSIKEIARQYGVSDTAIRKRARKRGWVRDPTDQVRAAVNAEIACGVRDGFAPANSREEDVAATIAIGIDRGVAAVQGDLHRAEQLKSLFRDMYGRLNRFLAGDMPEEEAQRLFRAKGDGVANLVRVVSDLPERIQRLERRALNLDADDAERRNRPPALIQELDLG